MISSLQSLRGIFAIMIFLTHFKWGGKVLFDAGGDLGVAFFFVLSGFALSAGYQRKISSRNFSTRQFMLRRIFKLYPLHLICLAAFILLNPSYLGSHIPETISNIMLLQSWIPLPEYYFSGNAVGWCLADFLFMYILFPTLSKRINHIAAPAHTQQSNAKRIHMGGGNYLYICDLYIHNLFNSTSIGKCNNIHQSFITHFRFFTWHITLATTLRLSDFKQCSSTPTCGSQIHY